MVSSKPPHQIKNMYRGSLLTRKRPVKFKILHQEQNELFTRCFPFSMHTQLLPPQQFHFLPHHPPSQAGRLKPKDSFLDSFYRKVFPLQNFGGNFDFFVPLAVRPCIASWLSWVLNTIDKESFRMLLAASDCQRKERHCIQWFASGRSSMI